MGWAGQTWLELIQEGTGGTAYGVLNGSPSGSQIIYPTLYNANSFTVRKVPQRQVIRTADAGNRRRQVVAARQVYQGVLNTLLHPDQAAYWITAATVLTNDAGGHPWLPSYTAHYWDSVQAWELLGGMIQSITITSSAMQDYVSLSMSWIFQTRNTAFTTFAQPAESVYSTLVPYEHFESASNFKLGGSAITKYQTLTTTVNNVLVGTWDELAYISALYYCGRNLDFSFGPQYLATTYRTDFESQTPLTFLVNWVRGSPAHSLLITCETNSYISSIDDQLPLDGPGYQTVNVEVFYDPANTTDFTTTVS
jgi:Phage tail tube protein